LLLIQSCRYPAALYFIACRMPVMQRKKSLKNIKLLVHLIMMSTATKVTGCHEIIQAIR